MTNWAIYIINIIMCLSIASMLMGIGIFLAKAQLFLFIRKMIFSSCLNELNVLCMILMQEQINFMILMLIMFGFMSLFGIMMRGSLLLMKMRCILPSTKSYKMIILYPCLVGLL